MGLPQAERCRALALQGVPEVVFRDFGHVVRLREDAAPQLSGRHSPFYVNEVKGKSALALSRDLGVQYKTSFVLAHKIREAMASELKGMQVGGEGKTVETDGGYFGGYIKPANHKENRRDRRFAKNQNGKRQVVVVVRERGGRTAIRN